MTAEIFMVVAITTYLVGLLPAFDYGRERYGWAILIFGWFWPWFLLWNGVANAYGGDWNDRFNNAAQKQNHEH
jgi:hypothetical protein